jgi:acetoin utilization deacetylase AcuC-like enzyme
MAPDTAAPSQNIDLFYHPASLLHDTGHHPESPDRLRAILRALHQHGIPQSALLEPSPVPRPVLELVHDPAYIDTLQTIANSGGGYWDLDTVISPHSFEAALLGAGAAVAAVDSVMRSPRPRLSFALVRPPGHHALRRSAMGFCLFNNVAVAASYAIHHYGLSRVLIVDWDIHHGNGTQDAFYDRPDVLFFSTHRYPFYPGTGALNETGARNGLGYTVNVPLPPAVGDHGYAQIFSDILVPLARRYLPELIIISAGYDAHADDPLGDASVSTSGFAHMAGVVRQLASEIPACKGRVAAVLEGGYNIEALADSVLATIDVLAAPPDHPLPPSTFTAAARTSREPDITPLLRRVRETHNL